MQILKLLSKFLKQLFLLFLTILLLVILFLYFHGIPGSWIQSYLKKHLPKDYACEVTHLWLTASPGFLFENLIIQNKSKPSPLLHCKSALIKFNPLAAFRQKTPIKILLTEGSIQLPKAKKPSGSPNPFPERIQFELSLNKMQINQVPIIHGNMEVALRSHQLNLNPVTLILGKQLPGNFIKGGLQADFSKDELTAELSGNSSKAMLNSILFHWFNHRKNIPVLDLLQFDSDALHFNAHFRKRPDPQAILELSSTILLKNFSSNKIEWTECRGQIHYIQSETQKKCQFKEFILKKDTQAEQLDLHWDIQDKTLSLSLQGGIHPKPLLQFFNLTPPPFLDKISLKGHFFNQVTGTWLFKQKEKTQLDMKFSGDSLLYNTLPVQDYDFQVLWKGKEIEINPAKGSFFGGSLTSTAKIQLPEIKGQPVFIDLQLTLDRASMQNLVQSLNPDLKKEIQGTLSGSITANSQTGEKFTDHIQGQGKIKIRDSRVIELPLFGGLITEVKNLLPHAIFQSGPATTKAEFKLNPEGIHIEPLFIPGESFQLDAKGDYGWNQSLNFYSQVRVSSGKSIPGKVINLLTSPLSKLFEFRLTGTKENPKWYPMNLSTDIVENIPIIGQLTKKEDSPTTPKAEEEIQPDAGVFTPSPVSP